MRTVVEVDQVRDRDLPGLKVGIDEGECHRESGATSGLNRSVQEMALLPDAVLRCPR